ncbi:hypothetical protein NKG05_23770 [Oerskovia sp. M15]
MVTGVGESASARGAQLGLAGGIGVRLDPGLDLLQEGGVAAAAS